MTIMQRMQAEMVKKRKGEKKGFTLVELVVVIAILAILAAIAIPVVTSIIKSANDNTFKSNVKSWDLAVKEVVAGVKAGTTEYAAYSMGTTVEKVLEDKGLVKDATDFANQLASKGDTNLKVLVSKGLVADTSTSGATALTSGTALSALGI